MTDIEKNNFLIAFGQRVRQARIDCKMTLEELAKKLGYSTENARSTMSKIEAGKSDLGASKIYTLAKILNVNECYLMGSNTSKNCINTKADEKPTLNEPQILQQISNKYGKQTEEAIKLFNKLDKEDKGKVIVKMETYLEAEKYSTQEELSNEKII